MWGFAQVRQVREPGGAMGTCRRSPSVMPPLTPSHGPQHTLELVPGSRLRRPEQARAGRGVSLGVMHANQAGKETGKPLGTTDKTQAAPKRGAPLDLGGAARLRPTAAPSPTPVQYPRDAACVQCSRCHSLPAPPPPAGPPSPIPGPFVRDPWWGAHRPGPACPAEPSHRYLGGHWGMGAWSGEGWAAWVYFYLTLFSVVCVSAWPFPFSVTWEPWGSLSYLPASPKTSPSVTSHPSGPDRGRTGQAGAWGGVAEPTGPQTPSQATGIVPSLFKNEMPLFVNP